MVCSTAAASVSTMRIERVVTESASLITKHQSQFG